MLLFNADPRDGGPTGAVCPTCCCQPLNLQPGETNLVTINYAPWVLPIAPPGIVPRMEFSVEEDSSACPTGDVDGFAPPSNTSYLLSTPINTLLAVDLTVNEAPLGNTFTYRVLPLNGPNHGTLSGAVATGVFSYTPNAGFEGYDYFYYEMTDAQGRSVVYPVRVMVGSPNVSPDPSKMATAPFIHTGAINTNQQMMTVQFPIFMPPSCTDCTSWRLTIKQPAKNCDGTIFYHLMCFDIQCKACD